MTAWIERMADPVRKNRGWPLLCTVLSRQNVISDLITWRQEKKMPSVLFSKKTMACNTKNKKIKDWNRWLKGNSNGPWMGQTAPYPSALIPKINSTQSPEQWPLHNLKLNGEVDYVSMRTSEKNDQISHQTLCPFRLPAAEKARLLLVRSIWFLIKFEGEDQHDNGLINPLTPDQYRVTQTWAKAKQGEENTLSLILEASRLGVGFHRLLWEDHW